MNRTTPESGQSLIDNDAQVITPYCAVRQGQRDAAWMPLAQHLTTHNAHIAPFRLDFSRIERLAVINGMGVALGDSIVGLQALYVLKQRWPHLRIRLYRSRHCAPGIEEAYALAGFFIEEVRYLPVALTTLRDEPCLVDLADFAFRPAFDRLPMMDFFFDSLGMAPELVSPTEKFPAWLADPCRPRGTLPQGVTEAGYVLLAPTASEPLRSIPRGVSELLVERLWQRYQRPVVCLLQALSHPHSVCLTTPLPRVADYIALVGGATHLVSTDTSALHIAAGLGVPTLGLYVSIDPALRCAHYPAHRALRISDAPELAGRHWHDTPEQLESAHAAWARFAAHPRLDECLSFSGKTPTSTAD